MDHLAHHPPPPPRPDDGTHLTEYLKNVITPIDIFLSDSGRYHATAYFQYDWTFRDGTLITFKVMDLFTFEPDSDRVTYLDLIYDTHPIRASAGNKYEL